MPLTPLKLMKVLFFLGAFGLLGVWLLSMSYEEWIRGHVLLTRRRVVPRLVTYAANPVEFSLRCAFLALLGGFFASFASVGLFGIVHRLAALRSRFFAGPFKSKASVRLMLVPLVCFAGWFGLLAFLPFAYD